MENKKILDKLNEGRQYRNIRMAGWEGQSTEDGSMTVEGYATTFEEPYELCRISDPEYIWEIWEQVDRNAFKDTDLSDVIMQYDHEGRVFARTSNSTLELTPDKKGLHVRANLGGTEIGRQLFEEIRGGYTDKMSFGFRVSKDRRDSTRTTDEETGVTTVRVLRTILEISKLYDVSAVSLPANDATSISARSFGEGVIEEAREEIRAAEKRERQRKKIKLLATL